MAISPSDFNPGNYEFKIRAGKKFSLNEMIELGRGLSGVKVTDVAIKSLEDKVAEEYGYIQKAKGYIMERAKQLKVEKMPEMEDVTIKQLFDKMKAEK